MSSIMTNRSNLLCGGFGVYWNQVTTLRGSERHNALLSMLQIRACVRSEGVVPDAIAWQMVNDKEVVWQELKQQEPS